MKADNIQDIYELSPAQQGILFHSLYSPESGVYFVQLCCTLRGYLNPEAFEDAWQRVVARHTVLRTSFYWENLDKPLQVVNRQVKLPFEQQDWREMAAKEQQEQLDTFLKRDRASGFSFAQAPLIRLTLIRIAEDAYQFIWSKHHLILDGWSTALVFKDFVQQYQALCQGQDLPLAASGAYGDYIAWLQQQDLAKAERFWRQALGGIQAPTPLISLTGDISPDQKPDYEEQHIKLSAETTTALQSLARQHQLTLNTLVQGAWALLLSRYSGESDVIYGNTVSGRPVDLVGAEAMVGLFINTLPVRVTIDSEQALVPWLQQLQTQLVEMRQYEYSPLVKVQGWSEIPRGVPLFESLVVFENYPVERGREKWNIDLEIHNVRSIEATNYPLTAIAIPGVELEFILSYNRHRFDQHTISRMLGHLQTLLQGMVAHPYHPLKDLPLLTDAELTKLWVEWNQTQRDYPQNHCLHQLFEAQASKTPDAVAVVFADKQLTYRQLNQKANQLAHYLKTLGVKPEVLVGICVERSIEMVVGLLGILKAGGAYVPFDPAYPPERLAFMLEDSHICVWLTQENLIATLPKHHAQVVCLDADWEGIRQCSDQPCPNRATPDNLAYIIYTSGSTGKPKGVEITHRALVNFLTAMGQTLGLSQNDSLLSVTTLSFDIAALELYLPLILGANVIILRRDIAANGIQLSQQLAQTQATVMQATPATWRLLLAAGWQQSSPLKILCGGEALSRELANQLLERSTEVWNLYGPTETTVWSAVYKVEPQEDKGIVAIGRPIANTEFYVLDSHQQPVPIGVPGELYIGGVGLARGYWHRAELTTEKFFTLDHLAKQDALPPRVYKTGDLVRYRADGILEYLGRIDEQVKVRGFRIELGEIETILTQHPAVAETAIALRQDERENPSLVAYVVLQPEQTLTSSQVRRFLAQKLPSYMIPSALMVLDKLPLTPNGKINRRALPAPDWSQRNPEQTYIAPRTPIEEVIAGIWTQVLGVQQVGVEDNFFDLGGHSLSATQVISRVRNVFPVELPLRTLFESPTVASLADSIQTIQDSHLHLPPLHPVSPEQPLPLSFAQERLWFLHQLEPTTATYNMHAAVRLTGVLDIQALEDSFNEIVRRHHVLRTNFTVVDGQPVQVIAPTLTLTISVVDLQGLSETEREAQVRRQAKGEALFPFDLAKGALLRIKLLKLNASEHILLFTIHHIVCDAWSLGVLIREFTQLYEAFVNGKPSPLPELPIQYADFANWQRQWLQGEVLDAQLSYWQRQLAGIPATLSLPIQRQPPAIPTFGSANQSFHLSSATSEQLQTLSRQEGVTLFMTLLAAFQTLLYRYSHQKDIVVGTDVANRNRQDIEPLIGFFVNLLVLRTDLSGNPSFRELLEQVRDVALAAYEHQDLPFAKLVEVLRPDRNSSHTPLFQVLFVLQNAPLPDLDLSGLTVKPVEINTEIARFDLALFMEQTDTGIIGTFKYNTDRFEAKGITQFCHQFETLISRILKNPDTRIDTLELLSEAEKQKQMTEQTQRKQVKFSKFKSIKPKAVSLPQRQLIKTRTLQPGQSLPLVIEPDSDEIDLADWSTSHREFLETNLLKHGAILFRGFNLNSAADFEKVANAIHPHLFGNYGDLPREGVSGKVYGSTPYPSDKTILFHNESSHLHRLPLKIWFFCIQPAQQGGETPILDCRQVYQRLNPKLREKFEQKQLMYVRNYTEGLDVSWQDFFHTTNKAEVEHYCRQADMEFEWLENNGLKTRKIRPAVAKHPKTGELVFFNQLQLHHISCLDSGVRQSLLSLFGEDKLPRHVYYGDGTPIEESVMEEIEAIYQASKISFTWQKGDMLMLDNMLTAHSRNPYVGSRKIVVAMADLITLA
ncbi:amino acid adenylation domain-containing protein [Coleofasciculus sp.]|uniref:amino acid adenylation domain-containing protein n=1 Tax=Coleofasciculus sp. TaxID=3100458 RepID=UPI0039F9AAF2